MSVPFAARIRATARRVRLQRALDAAALAGLAACACAGLGLLRQRLVGQQDALATWLLWVAAALPVLGGALAAARSVAPLLAAGRLDRAHGLHDLLSSAWAFAQEPQPERSPFMLATLARADAVAATLSAQRAQPLRAPPQLAALMCMAVGVALMHFLPVPHPAPARAPLRMRPATVLVRDDIEAARADLLALGKTTELTPAAREVSAQLRDLLEDLAQHRVDRAQALQRLQTLLQALEQDRAAAEQVGAALAQVERGLASAHVTERVAQALARQDPAATRAEAGQLVARLRAAKPDRRVLEELRAAVRATRERVKAAARAGESAAEATATQSLLHKPQKAELERALRQEREQRARQRELEQLERDLDQTEQALQQQKPQDAANDLEQAARDLQHMQNQQAGAQQSRALQEQLAQLQELVRRQHPDRDPKQEQEQEPQMKNAQAAQPTQQEQPRAGGQAGSGGTERLTLEAFRQRIGVRSKPGGDAQATQATQPSAQAGTGPGKSRQAGGAGGTPRSAAATALASGQQDTRVQGQAAAGPTRSEVIYEAARRGFASAAYQQVHADYDHYAQSELERDQIPGGYRFYVRRYFQLIRPRQDVHE